MTWWRHKWKHFPRNWPNHQPHGCLLNRLFRRRSKKTSKLRVTGLCVWYSPVPVNSPHKGQWRGVLMFSLICVWINGWVNNREAGDLIRHRGHYDVNVMNSGQRYLHETDKENRFNLVKESRCSYIQNVLGKLFICVSTGDRIVCDIYFHI